MPTLILLLILIVLIGAALIFRFRARLYARWLHLTPPQYEVGIERRISVKMRDGIILSTDHYAPHAAGDFPTILMRGPYGREPDDGGFGYILTFFACRFAERGYHVVTQDTRGRFRSGGIFDPYFQERDDGLDTLDWLQQQPWFNGILGTWGPSYLGITQWALAASTPLIKAMMPSITSSKLFTILFPDESFDLGLAMRWMAIFRAMDKGKSKPLLLGFWPLLGIEKTIAPTFVRLPVSEVDSLVNGEPMHYYQLWLEHSDPTSPLWNDIMKLIPLDQIIAAPHLVGGWYDFFLRGLLLDYAELKAAGKQPYLTIGPWYHFSHSMVMTDSLREGLSWFEAFLQGDRSHLRQSPVRLYVMGANQWRDFEIWPPVSRETRYYPHAGFALTQEPSREAELPDVYRYDPADPTPAVGGTQFSLWGGPRSNRKLETRPDVLVYTSDPLREPVEVIGFVRLELYVSSSLEYTDFFGRLCDVHPNGESINVCDGLFHVKPGKGCRQDDGTLRIEVDMWATAYYFQTNHRIRLQVSSGAHPRWIRNLGTGKTFSTETQMKVADQQVYHDAAHPSALLLPVFDSGVLRQGDKSAEN